MKYKNKFLIIISVLAVCTSSFVFESNNINRNKNALTVQNNYNTTSTVIIDAGHGGEDGGAVALDGTCEKDINLQIALKLDKILKFFGYNTVLTRKNDTAIYDKNKNFTSQKQKKVNDMHNRLNIAKSYENAIFVSIHLNKFDSNNVCGAQVFYSKTADGSLELAQNIQNSIKLNLEPNNDRLVKQNTDKIFLLKNATIPSVIVECGFLSNQNDLNNLKNNEFQYKIAMCIFLGIINYK